MDRIAEYVDRHTRRAYFFAVLLALVASLLIVLFIRDLRQHERLNRLETEAERCGIELLSLTMNGNQMGALGLLGLIDERVKREALGQQPPNSPALANLMEGIARANNAEGAFVVGKDGVIKASWGVGKPLTGVDVRFRPYAQMALKGKESVYAAIGTTTGRRTLYFASPIHAGITEDTSSIGAVVARSGVDKLDRLLSKSSKALLISPQGIVFAASRPEWIGCLTKPLTTELLTSIRSTKQFGTMFDSNTPTSLPLPADSGLHSFEGQRHAIVSVPVQWNDPMGPWKLVLLEDITRTVPILALVGPFLLIAFVLFLIEALLFKILRNHHAIRENQRTLEAFAKKQEAAAAGKSLIAAMTVHLQQSKNVEELATTFLSELHTLLGMLQGAIYRFDSSTQQLILAGSYACCEAPPERFELGEGLVGQCAVERKTLKIVTESCGFMMIRSGLGGTTPAAVILIPALFNDELCGVFEVALLNLPTTELVEQLEELASLLAMNIEIVDRKERTEVMLASIAAVEQSTSDQLAFQQMLIDTIPYPIFYKDSDARFLGFNRAYEETFNIRREDLIGKRVLDLDYLPEADRIAYQTEDEAVIAGAGTVNRELQIPFADGNMHDVLYFVSGFRRQDGSSGGLVGTFMDISQIRNVERSLALHESPNQESTI